MQRVLKYKRRGLAVLHVDWGLAAKALLLIVLAVQSARLAWAIVQPVGPVGDWRPAVARPLPPAMRSAIIASVNPFDRTAAGAAPGALANDLKLFGVRNNLSGLGGGAIIGTPDGQQVSVSVGEEIKPGVSLVAVGFDYADVRRQGGRQRIFLDQDKAPMSVGASYASKAAPTPPVANSGGTSATLAQIHQGIRFLPRQKDGAVDGVIVAQMGNDSAALNAAGLRAGDVITAVNGVRIQSATDAAQLQQSLVPGVSLTLNVERDGKPLSMTLKISGNP